jgi:hypothetical protein
MLPKISTAQKTGHRKVNARRAAGQDFNADKAESNRLREDFFRVEK